MTYFRNTPFFPYKFGETEDYTLHQDLGAYVDLVDQVRNNQSFYQEYTILDGDRPDNLSFKLYGDDLYYWTFFLMNENLRKQGWPITNQKLFELVKTERNNTVLTSREDLTSKFKVGEEVIGTQSGAVGTVVKRRLDLGQIIVEGVQNFVAGEEVYNIIDGEVTAVEIEGAVEQFNAVHHYEDADGNLTDIDPYTGPGAELVAISYYDRYVRQNDSLKEIIVIKPNVIGAVFEEFQNAMAEA